MSPSLYYRDAARAIDWLCEAFGFEIRLKVEGEPGQIVHSELTYGQGLIMVSGSAGPDAKPADDQDFRARHASPLELGGRYNQSICMYVDDVDAHHAQAVARGARVYSALALHDYGDDYWADRSYGAFDLEGHSWWFSQRVRDEPKK
jgi:uncharacterized glyoxalase superfamily protein PhnB